MKALVKTEPGPGLELTDVPEPPMGINDVRIGVHRTGICGTDLHIESWDPWAARTIKPPLVVGHEFVGEVLEIGSNVTDLAVGDRVSGEGHVVCGHCRHCRAGRWHLCANTVGLGVNRDGAFAEQVVLPVTNVWHHWPGIDEEVAAIFDPVRERRPHRAQLPDPRRGRSRRRRRPDRPDGDRRGPSRGCPLRRRERAEPVRRELATRMGATRVVDPIEEALRDVQGELGMVEGFDVVLEMSGNPTALRDALANMSHGASMAILGIPTAEIPIDVSQVVFNQLTLRGIYGREMFETWYKMSVLLQSGLDIRPVITDRFSYRDHEAAFAAARSGDSGKVLMDWRS